MLLSANCLECAVLRWSVSAGRGEFHLACYQILCFKRSFENQCSCIATDVADWKFNGARERHGVSFAPSPLCLRTLGALPVGRSWIEQQQRSLSAGLTIKPQ